MADSMENAENDKPEEEEVVSPKRLRKYSLAKDDETNYTADVKT